MAWPAAAIPLPGGSPVPSGRTSMFSAAICAAFAGWPKPNRPPLLTAPCAALAPAACCAPADNTSWRDRPPASSTATRTSRTMEVDCRMADASPILRLHIGHLPVHGHVPANDAVEHLAEVGSARRDQLGARGLDVAGLVGRPALEDRLAAIPNPWETKAGVADRQDRFLQRCLAPGLAAIGAHLHACDAPSARPGDARDLPEAGLRDGHPAGRSRDGRLRLQDEGQLNGLAIGLREGVERGFVPRHERLVPELEPPQPLDVRIADPAGQQQPGWIALFGPQRLAILAVGHQTIRQQLLNGD